MASPISTVHNLDDHRIKENLDRGESSALVSPSNDLDDIMDQQTKSYIDSECRAMRAEHHADLERVFSKIDQISVRSASARDVWAAVGTGAGVVLGVVLATLAFGFDRFDGGVQVGVSVPMENQIEYNRDAIVGLNAKVDSVVESQSEILIAIRSISPIPEIRVSPD